MSKTIAEKLVILSDGLELIDQERQYQTDLILNLQDSLEQLSTPIPQSAPLITIDDSTGIITASVTQEQGGYVAPGTLQTQAEVKYHSQNLLPKNIKSGIRILGVTGTMSSGIDTSDATAVANDIVKNKTAYVNGSKITGTLEEADLEVPYVTNINQETGVLTLGCGISSGYIPTATTSTTTYDLPTASGTTITPSTSVQTAINKGKYAIGDIKVAAIPSSYVQPSATKAAATITPSTANQTIAAGTYLTGAQTIAGDADLTAGNIRNGVNIFNVTGTYTSDATADTTHILKDKIAYSKGSKITGTMTNNGTVSPAALSAGGSYTIPAGYHSGSGKVTAKTLAEQTSANAAASNILINKTAWVGGTKVTGTMADNGAVSPTALNAGGSYTIPVVYHNGSGKVTAASLAGQTSGTAAASHIAADKTAWVNGNKITGTLALQSKIQSSLPNGKVGVGSYQGSNNCLVITNTILPGSSGYYNSVNDSQTQVASWCTLASLGDATAAQVLTGKTFTSAAGFKATGTMANQGAKTATLDAGGSYTIPEGYHNGSGKVTANSLASQTSGSAAANEILSGETAWVNGTKITGNLKKMTATIDEASDILYITIT